jgi:hypothetical protein
VKLFLWQRLPEVTSDYHCEGGLVVVAEVAPTTWDIQEGLGKVKTVVLPAPDRTYEVGNADPETIVFPDAGCC